MSTFSLKIVTPDGLIFDGEAQRMIVRTTEGDMAVMARHVGWVAPLGMGRATVVDAEGRRRYAACIGGILSVVNGNTTLLPTSFEWADQIDLSRAEASRKRAEKILRDPNSTAADIHLAEARLQRALVRQGVASNK